ncbi:MAG TPA: hypothetical protein VE964_03085 [Myxococcales bacterium]|nr:hypothetical protein [Myxococcales bacterium]
MSSPWDNVKPGDPNGFRTNLHLARQAQYNQQLKGVAGAAAGLIDSCGPPYWDQHSWDRFKEVTGREPFTASELPPSFEGCPAWAYHRMGLRPPLMAQ